MLLHRHACCATFPHRTRFVREGRLQAAQLTPAHPPKSCPTDQPHLECNLTESTTHDSRDHTDVTELWPASAAFAPVSRMVCTLPDPIDRARGPGSLDRSAFLGLARLLSSQHAPQGPCQHAIPAAAAGDWSLLPLCIPRAHPTVAFPHASYLTGVLLYYLLPALPRQHLSSLPASGLFFFPVILGRGPQLASTPFHSASATTASLP